MGKMNINWSLKLKATPNVKKDKLYFSLINKYRDSKTKVVYMLSHWAHILLFNMMVGKSNITNQDRYEFLEWVNSLTIK